MNFYLQEDFDGRCVGKPSQSKGNALQSCSKDFEASRLGVFATPGFPRLGP